jgi:hypothetical protein
MTISDKELDRQHDMNCRIIARALMCLNLNDCIDWRKVKIKIDDKSNYILKKEQKNDTAK